MILSLLALLLCVPAWADDNAPILNVIAIDRSGSTATMRPVFLKLVRAAFFRAGRWGEDATIYVVDSRSACVFSPTTLKRNTPFPQSVLKELETPAGNRAKRTRPALFWEQMARDYSDSKRSVRILFLTDGGNDWAGEEARVKAAVTQLARNPNVTVGILGLNKDLYEPVRRQFAAFDTGRTFFGIGGDATTLISKIGEWREMGAKP